MTLYELIFILLFLSSFIVIIGLVILIATGRRSAAWKTLLGVGAFWCLYFALLAASDLMAKPLVIPPGQNRCFDEMCFAVVNAQTLTSPTANSAERRLYVITIRVTSHSRGRTQAEGGIRARLYDHGEYFGTSKQAQKEYEQEHGNSPLLSQELAPGQSIESVLVFDLPKRASHPGLTLDHGFTPAYFVIGESPFFHEPDILALPPDQSRYVGLAEVCPPIVS